MKQINMKQIGKPLVTIGVITMIMVISSLSGCLENQSQYGQVQQAQQPAFRQVQQVQQVQQNVGNLNLNYFVSNSNICGADEVGTRIKDGIVTSRNGCLFVGVPPANDHISGIYINGNQVNFGSQPYTLDYYEGTFNIRIVTRNGENTITVPISYLKTTFIDITE
jgi:hypothetical protein